MAMKNLFLSVLVAAFATEAAAQESHYHRSLRSQDEGYGLIVEAPANSNGMMWSRVRDIDDVAITAPETHADSIARRAAFIRFCEQAYDAYEKKDYYHTITFGDSALSKRYHTPDLYYFMAVSFEQLGDYKDAEWGYKMAMRSGYQKEPAAYADFKERMKARKAEQKRLRREAKRKKQR